MKTLFDCKNEIHSCSKCGLCQSVCPIYKITGNDCTVSRGHFIMLKAFLKGEIKMSKTINKYLDLCLKCNACSKFCPSGIDVVDIVALAKAEYFKQHFAEKIKSFVLKIGIKSLNLFNKVLHQIIKTKSKAHFEKVIYFGGCGGANKNVIKILNAMDIEVITPDFECCGFPFFVCGDMKTFEQYIENFYKVLEKYDTYDVVVNCATCEKTLKSYPKWHNNRKEVNIKNVFEYIKENNPALELKKPKKVTFHKPCNMDNFDDIKDILNNIKNLEYVEMKDYDSCCGLEGLANFKEHKIVSKLFKEKHENIRNTGVKTVLTSCLACKVTLSLFSKGKYKVQDFVDFLAKNIK